MENSLVDDGLAVAVIDALTSQICVVDRKGTITAVNLAWKQFSADNSAGRVTDYIGMNYLNVCKASVGPASEEASAFLNGLRAVLQGSEKLFQIEYPCHSPLELRWFLARVSPLRRRSSASDENIGAVVSHMNITDRKLIESNYARLANTDSLTGVPNRRFFYDFAKLDMERFLRFGRPSSLLMIDLDNFKLINDTYGHAAGDEVLRNVSSVGASVFRTCDLFARLGGEEFACLLLDTDEWGGIMAAEKLRKAIEELRIEIGAKTISITVSVGVSSFHKGDSDVGAVLARADQAMYRAKGDGRNRVKT